MPTVPTMLLIVLLLCACSPPPYEVSVPDLEFTVTPHQKITDSIRHKAHFVGRDPHNTYILEILTIHLTKIGNKEDLWLKVVSYYDKLQVEKLSPLALIQHTGDLTMAMVEYEDRSNWILSVSDTGMSTIQLAVPRKLTTMGFGLAVQNFQDPLFGVFHHLDPDDPLPIVHWKLEYRDNTWHEDLQLDTGGSTL